MGPALPWFGNRTTVVTDQMFIFLTEMCIVGRIQRIGISEVRTAQGMGQRNAVNVNDDITGVRGIVIDVRDITVATNDQNIPSRRAMTRAVNAFQV